MQNSGERTVSLSALGVGLLHAWLWSVLYSVIVYPFNDTSAETHLAIMVCWNATLIVSYAAMTALNSMLSELHLRRKITGAFSIIGSLGTFFVSVSPYQSLVDPLQLALAGVVLVALGMSMLNVAWTQSFSYMDYRQVQASSALFIAFGATMFLICTLIPRNLAVVAVALFPIISFALMQTKDMTSLRASQGEANARNKQMSKFPYALFVLCLFLFAVANSYLRGLTLSFVSLQYNMGAQLLFSSIIAIGFVLAFAKSQKLIYSGAVLLIAGGLGLLPFTTSGVGTAMVGLGFICFEVLAWMVIAETIKKHRGSSVRIASATWMGLSGGSLVGILAGTAVTYYGGTQTIVGVAVSLALAYGILIVFVLTFNRTFLDVFKPAPDKNQPLSLIVKKGASFAREYGLTERETEVMQILINGRNAKYIEKSLFISSNTVKSHIKNIYRKAEVNSKEELLDKVLEMEASGIDD